MGELASESQGSKELGKTFGWEEGLEDLPRQVSRTGCQKLSFILNKKNSFKTAELVRVFSMESGTYRAALESCWELTLVGWSSLKGLAKPHLEALGLRLK